MCFPSVVDFALSETLSDNEIKEIHFSANKLIEIKLKKIADIMPAVFQYSKSDTTDYSEFKSKIESFQRFAKSICSSNHLCSSCLISKINEIYDAVENMENTLKSMDCDVGKLLYVISFVKSCIDLCLVRCLFQMLRYKEKSTFLLLETSEFYISNIKTMQEYHEILKKYSLCVKIIIKENLISDKSYESYFKKLERLQIFFGDIAEYMISSQENKNKLKIMHLKKYKEYERALHYLYKTEKTLHEKSSYKY